MKKYLNIHLIILLIILFLPFILKADPSIDPTPGDPDAAPIDGGLSLLIAGGVGYGVKKIREKRKKHQEEMKK